MSTAHSAAAHGGHGHHGHDEGQSPLELGFWFYLMTDCILFACFFAAYAVLAGNTAGSVSGKEIFELKYVLVETFVLLGSSLTNGIAMVRAKQHNKAATLRWLALTLLLGLVFIGMEINEFHHLIAAGHGPQTSAFLSAFFALVGLHGLHVTAGSIWMIVLMLEVGAKGLSDRVLGRLNCLALFWHFLDVVWICVFTAVYLQGAL
ncbi:cytochrome o ubiquinol oxidase subunit III [Jeongeupia wiesaeckerbachi]|uniref:cytochrome o ubiquinol oxidase subunit III n=1 Tax=Jeongeupia wiesaeckerbachi TaxID=3051218 RepID=UPI003D8002C1